MKKHSLNLRCLWFFNLGQNPQSSLYALVIGFLFCTLPFIGFAQHHHQCGVIVKSFQPEENIEFYDRFGNGYTKDEIKIKDLNIQKNHCDQIEDFELIFENTGGTYPFSTVEMEVICDVFTYLSGIIDAPSGDRARIRLSKDPNLAPGTAAVATPLFLHDCGDGHSIIHEQFLVGSVTAAQHGFINFHPGITNYYYGDDGASIGFDQLDYYTVVLHEALHLLGFASQIGPDGAPAQGFYTLWDLNLMNTDGHYIINAQAATDACCNDYSFNVEANPGWPDVVLNQNCGIHFNVPASPPVNGEYGNNPDVNTFLNMLSHLDRDCGNEHYVMHYNIPEGIDGVQRTLTGAELEILCRLGYPTTLPACEPDCIAVAVNDGPYFVPHLQTITITANELMQNDFPANATFEFLPNCGSHAGLTISNTGTSITITGDEMGAYTLCYAIRSCDGRLCDNATVRIVVTNPAIAEACNTLEECQINPFWDFELFESSDEMYPLLTLGVGNGMGDGTTNTGFSFDVTTPYYDNTPDFFSNTFFINQQRSCGSGLLGPFPIPFGNNAIGLILRRIDGVNTVEGATFPLCEPIFPGMSGAVTFFAMTPNNCINTSMSQIRIDFSENPPVNQQTLYTNPGVLFSQFVTITNTESTNPIFGQYEVNFTNNSDVCWNHLYISGWAQSDNYPNFGYIVIDNARVTLQSNIANVMDLDISTIRPEPCLNEIVNIEVDLCVPECDGEDFVHPDLLVNIDIPAGLTHVPTADFPTPNIIIPSGTITSQCTTLTLSVRVGTDPLLIGQELPVQVVLDPADGCYGPARLGQNLTPVECPGTDCAPEGRVSTILCIEQTETATTYFVQWSFPLVDGISPCPGLTNLNVRNSQGVIIGSFDLLDYDGVVGFEGVLTIFQPNSITDICWEVPYCDKERRRCGTAEVCPRDIQVYPCTNPNGPVPCTDIDIIADQVICDRENNYQVTLHVITDIPATINTTNCSQFAIMANSMTGSTFAQFTGINVPPVNGVHHIDQIITLNWTGVFPENDIMCIELIIRQDFNCWPTDGNICTGRACFDFSDVDCGGDGGGRERSSTEQVVNHRISLQPNPTSNEVTVAFDIEKADSQAIIEVVDMYGRTLYQSITQSGQGKIQVNTSQYSTGIYCVILKDINGRPIDKRLLMINK
jgi:hypothetical protein